MEEEVPISMATPVSWMNDENNSNIQQWLFFSVVTLALAFCMHRAFFATRSKRATTSNDASYRESRLLRHQFGLLLLEKEEHDLKLQVEQDDKTKEDNDPSPSADDSFAEAAPAPSVEEPIALLKKAVPVEASLVDEDHQNLEAISLDSVITKIKGSDGTVPSTSRRERRTPKQWERWQQHRRQRVAAAADHRRQHQNATSPLNAFWHWWDVETSLFRIYTIPRIDGRMDDETTIPPYNPSSKRGHVPILLHVTNDLPTTTVTVCWIDFLGKYVQKGTILPLGGTWRQTTWIDHPWVFCDAETNTPLLHYIPYRVIPTLREAPTMEDEEGNGVHRFHIVPADPTDACLCQVEDPILPYPAARHLTSPRQAAEFALRHCRRMQYTEWAVLLQYLDGILQHPDQPQYRRMRLANPTFGPGVWQTPARGVWLALGFVETTDGYAEWRTAGDDAVTPVLIDEWSLWRHMIQVCQAAAEDDRWLPQPEGADGYGRAGFGR
jgi:VHL beta domain/PUB domain